MAIVDGRGNPLAMQLSSASLGEVKRLIAAKAYDSNPLRKRLSDRKIIPLFLLAVITRKQLTKMVGACGAIVNDGWWKELLLGVGTLGESLCDGNAAHRCTRLSYKLRSE